jgi:hypothetical protein
MSGKKQQAPTVSKTYSLTEVGGEPAKRGFKTDYDGLTMRQEESLSVERVTRANAAGKTQQELEKEWKQAVMQRLKDLKKEDEINYLNQHNWLGDQKDAQGNLLDPTGQGQPLDGNDAFGDLWQRGTPKFQKANPNASSDRVYQGYTWGKGKRTSDEYLAGAMSGKKADKKKGTPGRSMLMHDPAFQTTTTVQRKHADGTRQSANPLRDNFAVGARPGDLVKVTYPNGDVHYMPTDDVNPNSNFFNPSSQSNLGEVSKHAQNGYPAGTKTGVTMQVVGRLSNPLSGDYLTNEEWDEIGSNNYRNPDGTYPNTRKQLEAAREAAGKNKPPPKTASNAGGGPLLLVGHPTVMHGADFRNVGYANAVSEHAAGGWMAYGSNTVFVGPERFPVSRVGDETSDGQAAVTGAEDFFIGGTPTSEPGPSSLA